MKKFLILSILFMGFAVAGFSSTVWVEAESFTKKGGWVVDQQFMDQMGSPYLMAHGLGKPVEDASTEITIPENGKYNVYVRTFNWTSPWSKSTGPGAFKVSIDNRSLSTTVGVSGSKWEWQKAGTMNLKKGTYTLTLKDLTGFNGRCDAVCLTTDPTLTLPDGGAALTALRRDMLGLDRTAPQTESYDMVVVGGGIAGMCAAVSAARNGMKVALVNDRPVLGGNNSSEVRVHLGGRIELGPYKGLGRMIREFGHSKFGNAQPAEEYEDDKKEAFIAAEENITLYPNYRAVSVEKDGNKIKSVRLSNVESANEIVLAAPLFADCTGDGNVGYLAGADYAMGRESRDVYNESLAPEVADSMTMGASMQWYSKRDAKRSKFPEFNYGMQFNDTNCLRVKSGEWRWECGMNRNQVTEAERVRDQGLMAVYSNWSYLKNHAPDKDEYSNDSLDWLAYIAGKRESRRLLGDYILKQDDIDKYVSHEDASFATSWGVDLHFPDPVNWKNFPEDPFQGASKHINIYPYPVPYRCLYSRNVDNLFMAGRDISVSRVALGTVRVMRTGGMMGEVVGMAASLCKKHGVTPRGVYQKHLPELKEMMREGVGKPADELPDNQNFNRMKLLDAPRAFGPSDPYPGGLED